MKFVQESFRIGDIIKGMNKSFIVLILKLKHSTEFSHFKPISLYSFIYKIIFKIITSRLKVLIPKLISPNQGVFVEGRWIEDNTMLAQELVHKIKKHKGNNDLMIAKIDLKKAFDRIKWHFVDKVLASWGFSVRFQRIIFACMSSITYSVLINGRSQGEVEPTRGLRQ